MRTSRVTVGTWIERIWDLLALSDCIAIKGSKGELRDNVSMWRYRCLQECVLEMDIGLQKANSGDKASVVHVDTDALLDSDVDDRLITHEPWGIHCKPDFHFGGILGGAVPYPVDKCADTVAVDPYGAESPEYMVEDGFANMWCSAPAFCRSRFAGKRDKLRNESAGGLGGFTPDNFPTFDSFLENGYIVADSNQGCKLVGVGHLFAAELLGNPQRLPEPFRYSHNAAGDLHPVSNSPYPWS